MRITIKLNDINKSEIEVSILNDWTVPNVRHEKKWFRKHKMILYKGSVEDRFSYRNKADCDKDMKIVKNIAMFLNKLTPYKLEKRVSRHVMSVYQATIKDLMWFTKYRTKVIGGNNIKVELYNPVDTNCKRVVTITGSKKMVESRRRDIKKLMKKNVFVINTTEDVTNLYKSFSKFIQGN